MSWWFIYWLTRLGDLRVIAGFLTLCFGLGFVIILLLYLWSRIDDEAWSDRVSLETTRKRLRNTLLLFMIPLFFTISALAFIPRTKEAAAIYLIPKMVNNEAVQEIPNDAAKLLQLKLEEWINDIGGKKDTGGGK